MVDEHSGGLHEDGNQGSICRCCADALASTVVADEDNESRDIDEVLGDNNRRAHVNLQSLTLITS